MQLNNKTLHSLDRRIHIPAYDRSSISAGIVHIGIGNFHRSHQAYIIDRYIRETNSNTWGICAVGLLPQDEQISKRMEQQDCLFTLTEKKEDGTVNVRVIGSIIKCLHAPADPQRTIGQMASPDTKIITLTITEGGYNFDSSTGKFITDNPLVRHDIEHQGNPLTVFGYLCEALDLRRKTDSGGITILSCDNIQHNGDILKKMLLAYINLANPGLKEWVLDNIAFPNSMVDRITPVSVVEDADLLKHEFRTEDLCPVVSETFFQWVIEDNFKNIRPSLEQVGVKFVKDVTPYENMKLRLLNAGHSFIGFLGKRAGYRYIHEAAADKSIMNLLMRFYNEEAIPNINDFTVSELNGYINILIDRFGNPYIRDHIDRILSGSSAKIPKFLLPTITDQILKDRPAGLGILIIAAWYCYIGELNDPEEINDGMGALLFDIVHNPGPGGHLEFIAFAPVFGDLAKSKSFVKQYEAALNDLRSQDNEMGK